MHRRKMRSSGGSSIGGLECSRSSRHISLAMKCDFFEHRLHSKDAGPRGTATQLRAPSAASFVKIFRGMPCDVPAARMLKPPFKPCLGKCRLKSFGSQKQPNKLLFVVWRFHESTMTISSDYCRRVTTRVPKEKPRHQNHRGFVFANADQRRSSTPPEQRSEYAPRNSTGAVHSLQLLELALVEPDPTTIGTLVNLNLLRLLLLEVPATARAFIVMCAALRLPALGIQLDPHFMDDLEVLLGEIFLLVSAGLFIRWHRRSGRDRKYISPCAARRRVRPEKIPANSAPGFSIDAAK